MEAIKINDEILKKAIEVWGKEAQTDMVVEECAELIQALQKIKRKSADPKKAYIDLIGEIADVSIVLRQAQLMFGLNDTIQQAVDFKMDRLRQRLEDEK